MSDFVLAGEGDFFSQEEWAEAFEHVICVDVADIPLPKGDLTPQYCPDPARKGKFKMYTQVRGEPAMPTTTLSMPLSTAGANYLLDLDCTINGWITYNCDGSRGDPENYQLGVLLYGMVVSNSSILAEAVARGPDQEDVIDTNAELGFQDRLLFYQIAFAVQGLDNTANANAIEFLPKTCETHCTDARGLCEEGYMALDGTLYNSEIKKTHNGGADWAPCPTDPFMYGGGDASDIVLVTTATGHRAIISRGSEQHGEPAEVAISTDWGVTWAQVDVGAMFGPAWGQYITRMFYWGGKIWAVCGAGPAAGGYVYRSDDLGDTWTLLEAGVETNETLNDICMYSFDDGYAVGDNNAFLFTTDGDDFNLRVGPALGVNLLSVRVNEKGHVFVGAADGTLYVSEDAGVTWTTRRAFGAGSIDRIEFDLSLRYVGVLIHNTGDPIGTAYRSHDGGATWQAPVGQAGAWNAGLNDIFICDQNNFFVVGNTFNGTTFVAKATP